jgi:HK97 family phage prohead protease
MAPELERRTFAGAALTLEAEDRAARTSGRRFTGYAAVFGSDSEPLPFTETIRSGAFTRSLGTGRNVRLFANHDEGRLLATTGAGTLRLTEDARGLKVSADLPDTTDGRDLAELIRRGDVVGMSFGFKTNRDRWSADGARRELLDVDLFEVSIVTGWPAYPATSASVQ